MTNFELVLTIDSASVDQLRAAGQAVLLTRVVDNMPGGVIWLSLEPALSSTVTIGSDYFLYAAQGPLQSGSLIVPRMLVPGDFGKLYPFDPQTMQFSPPEPGGPPDGFAVQVENKPGGPVAIGLAQGSPPMSPGPLSAVEVFPGQRIPLSPTSEVVIAVAQRMQAGTCHPQPLPNASPVKYRPDQPFLKMRYDAVLGKFVPES